MCSRESMVPAHNPGNLVCERNGRGACRASGGLFNDAIPDQSRHAALGDEGFSLIEMLVALVVLSLSLTVLYQAAIGSTRNVRVAAEYTDAVMLAESMLAEHSFITDENYAASGQFGSYDWSVKSWPVESAQSAEGEILAAQPQPLQYLEVVVSWPGGTDSRSLDLLTVVPLMVMPE